MSTRSRIIVGYIIVVGFISLCAILLLPYWDLGNAGSYLFMVLGITSYFGSIYFLASQKFSKAPWRIPVIRAGFIHMILASVTTVIYLLLFSFAKIPESLNESTKGFYMAVYVIIHLAWIAITVFRYNALLAGAKIIDDVNLNRAANTNAQRYLALEAASLVSAAEHLPEDKRDEIIKLVQKIADAVKYSDPVVPPRLVGFDESIRSGISDIRLLLDQAYNDDEDGIELLRKKSEDLLIAIQNRNEKVKIAKRTES